MRGKNRIYTEELLREAAKTSESISEVCRKVGIDRPGGGSYELVKNRLKELDIDTSHFLGYRVLAGKRGIAFKNRQKPEEVLISNVPYRVSHRRLKRALLESGIEYRCSSCGIDSWLGKPLTLDIDHRDGDWTNCSINNLEFVCPNCHRQTDTFGGRNKKKNGTVTQR